MHFIRNAMQEKTFYAIVIAIVLIGGIGIGIAYYHAPAAQPAASSEVTPYQLTLVVTTGNYFNATSDQPAFYVLVNGTLQSSATIHLPSNRLINLTIINYDDGAAFPLGNPVDNSFYNVTGTVGNVINIVNNTNVNSTATSSGININGGVQVSNISLNNVAHTFTILNGTSTMVNIPLPASSIVHAQLYLTQSGTYTWQCEAPCGTDVAGELPGWGQAMITAGWMTGSVVVA